ncbi:hypothetical protein C7293_23975 [filamentous cyanobacterium CCT1]|nr:hypothetical protein C7293_23975 [filamentous cyanobacterium CCT1]PSN78297.1 hypothetical protein C8B47_17620 [filamentous cyanobacterium CCP4]
MALSRHSMASVPLASQSSSEAQSIYRLWSNPEVSSEAILNSHSEGTVARAQACETVCRFKTVPSLTLRVIRKPWLGLSQ